MLGAMHPEPQPDGTWTIYLDPDWPGFAGHFPGAALVPAGMVIDWALSIIGSVKTLKHAKFTAPLKPGDQVVIIRSGLKFEFQCGPHTKAVLHFRDTASPSAPTPLR